MAVRKSVTESVVVAGERDLWLDKSRKAFQRAGFRDVKADAALYQVAGKMRRATIAGSLQVTLLPDPAGTRIDMRATANTDNIYALFRSPTTALLQRFKDHLS